MTTEPVEFVPRASPIVVIAQPVHRWTLAELRTFTSTVPRGLRWRILPAALQFVLVSLLAAVVVLGSIAALLAAFAAWYGPALAPALHTLGF